MSQSWHKRCDIKYCKHNSIITKEPVTVHPTPRCPKLFEKWEAAVSCTGTRLRRNGRICERHFDPDDIMEFGCSKKEKTSSTTIVTENIKLKVLVNGAVPKRFENEIAEHLRQKDLHSETEFIAVDTLDTEEIPLRPKRPRRLEVISSNTVLTAPQQTKAVEKLKSPEEQLFEKIYTGQIAPRLPSRSWNIHNCQIPENGFVFSEIAPLSLDDSTPPLFRKSIFFDGNFNMRVYFIGKYFPNVEFNKPKTIRDVEELLRNINAIKLCEGGPHLSEKLNFKFAYKDERMFKWRHVSCVLRLKRGHICKYCSELIRKLAATSNVKEKAKEMKKGKTDDKIGDMKGYKIENLDFDD